MSEMLKEMRRAFGYDSIPLRGYYLSHRFGKANLALANAYYPSYARILGEDS